MSDEKIKKFFKLLNKLETLEETIVKNNVSEEYKRIVALCLTELYFRSKHLIDLIKAISETKLNYTEKDLDKLLENLVYLQIVIYDEMVDWMKDLKKPLKKLINKLPDKVE